MINYEVKIKPFISIIMPVYNVENYLATAIKSFSEQTLANIELICIDDGSSDTSLELMNYYASLDKRIRIIHSNNNGPAKARNIGLDNAEGKYIMFLDSDDYIEPGACELLYTMAENENIDILVFGGNVFASENAPEWILRKLSPCEKLYEKFDPKIIFKEESARPFIWLHFIRRSIIEKKPKVRFDESMHLGEDQIFQFQYLPKSNRVKFVSNKLYNYRINRNSSLMSLYSHLPYTKFETHIALCMKVMTNWKESGLLLKYGTYILEWVTEFLYWDFTYFRDDLKYKYSLIIEEMVSKVEVSIKTMTEYIREYLETMLSYTTKKCEVGELIDAVNTEIAEIELSILKTVNSKKFRLGKILTKRKQRLPKEIYEEINKISK